MFRLRTRLDRDDQKVFWRLGNANQEYDNLAELLREHNLVFSNEDSNVIVKMFRQTRMLAWLTYTVCYDPDTDTVELDGLLGNYHGAVFDTFVRFGNNHIDCGNKHNVEVRFTKNYRAKENNSDYDSDSGNEHVLT